MMGHNADFLLIRRLRLGKARCKFWSLPCFSPLKHELDKLPTEF